MPDPSKSSATEPPTATKPPKPAKPKRQRKSDPRASSRVDRLPPYHVILLDDDQHTFEYVIEMLKAVFGYHEQIGFKMAETVDKTGRVIVLTTHREKAELKRDLILGFGADQRIASCKTSMRAMIEPAET